MSNRNLRPRRRRGAIIVVVLIMLVVFLTAAVIAIEISHIQLVQTQLRSATDAAAMAGAESLAEGNDAAIVRRDVKRIAFENEVARKGLELRDSEILLGRSQVRPNGSYSFVSGATPYNSVQVLGRRDDGSLGGSVSTLMGGMMGVKSFTPNKAATATIEERDIIVVVDRSGSMSRRDARHPITRRRITRMEALKWAVGQFRAALDDTPHQEKLGLVSYSTRARIEAQLSTDYSEFDRKLAAMRASGMTAIGEGIREAANELKSPRRRMGANPVVIVMTDGQHNRGVEPVPVVVDANNDDELTGLAVHAVTFSRGADRRRMQNTADVGNGRYVHADDASDLAIHFEDLARAAGGILIQ